MKAENRGFSTSGEWRRSPDGYLLMNAMSTWLAPKVETRSHSRDTHHHAGGFRVAERRHRPPSRLTVTRGEIFSFLFPGTMHDCKLNEYACRNYICFLVSRFCCTREQMSSHDFYSQRMHFFRTDAILFIAEYWKLEHKAHCELVGGGKKDTRIGWAAHAARSWVNIRPIMGHRKVKPPMIWKGPTSRNLSNN